MKESAFRICLDLRPHYGVVTAPPEEQLELVSRAVAERTVKTFFISESVSGSEDISAAELAGEVVRRGGEPVVSVSLTAFPRERIIENLQKHRDHGVRTILLVTGDYPARKGKGKKPCFDLDSVQLFMYLRERAGGNDNFPWDFVKGCVVSPFKETEAEQVWQYEKLIRKVESGSDFIVSQAGFDPRKWDELIRFCRLANLQQPLIGNVVIPDLPLARAFFGGEVPGISLPQALMENMVKESAAGSGREGRLRRAAKSVALLRSLGYSGALIGGVPLNYDEIRFILEGAEKRVADGDILGPETEFPEPKRFYYFQPGRGEGELNRDERRPLKPRGRRRPMYIFSHFVDYVAFGSAEPIFQVLVRVCRFCDGKRFWYRALWLFELFAKYPLYRCRMCGDCTLYATGFLCYESCCPKRMLNGPCGGSVKGYCEVYPGRKKCFWVRAYDRFKGITEGPTFVTPPIAPKDRSLDGTCSWINYCLGRDHRKFHEEADSGLS